jgi:hypothetical protein
MHYKGGCKNSLLKGLKPQNPVVTLPSLQKGELLMASGIARPHLNKEL